MTDVQGRALPLRAPTAAFCAEVIPPVIARRSRSNLVVLKRGLPRPLRGLAMTDLAPFGCGI